jgi:hypothetical protein
MTGTAQPGLGANQMSQLSQFLIVGFVIVALFSLVLVCLETGRRIGIRHKQQGTELSSAGLTAVDGAVFGLMGLIIAFTFSGAASRFDARRQLIVQETNHIGTAYLRIDLLPPASQPSLREDFRNYLDLRLAFYRHLITDPEARQADDARSVALQQKIWAEAVAGCRELNSPATTSLVLSSLNEMIDITTTRAVALETHPPVAIYWGLLVLVLASSFLAGYGLAEAKKRNWIHLLVYAAVMAAVVYVILDLEFPRMGFIRIDAADRILMDLRASMK